jgi:hypothetical protein
MITPGVSKARGPFDVVGASGGTDLGDINPDSASFLIQALAAHLDKITAVVTANKDAPLEQVEYDVDAANIPAGGLSFHLPSGTAIVGYYLENNSANTISVCVGPSPSGRSLNAIGGNAFKSSPLPQQVTSLCITTSGSAVGLVRLLLSTQNLGPMIGTTSSASGGAVSVTNFPATQPVSGTFWQATQPVSGTFWQATQPVSGTFWQATQPVSGTFWQTTQPVSIAAAVPTTQQISNTGTGSSVAVTTTAATALAINANRICASAYNLPTSASTALLAVGFTATAASYTVALVPGAYFELPLNFKGVLSAIAAAGTASLLMTEYT